MLSWKTILVRIILACILAASHFGRFALQVAGIPLSSTETTAFTSPNDNSNTNDRSTASGSWYPSDYPGLLLRKRNPMLFTSLRCTPTQVNAINDAWNDVTILANVALHVLQSKKAEHIVRKWFFAVTDQDRQNIIGKMYLRLANSATGRLGNFLIACGDFKKGDPITPNLGQHRQDMDGCSDEDTQGYVHGIGNPKGGQELGWATNDIALCPKWFNAGRTGSFVRALSNVGGIARQAFCDETDISPDILDPEDRPRLRREYFRGFVLLHELTHTINIGAFIKSKGPCDRSYAPGTADFTYDEGEHSLLSPQQSVRNAQTYSNFAWEAIYWVLCQGKTPLHIPQVVDVNAWVDWEALERDFADQINTQARFRMKPRGVVKTSKSKSSATAAQRQKKQRVKSQITGVYPPGKPKPPNAKPVRKLDTHRCLRSGEVPLGSDEKFITSSQKMTASSLKRAQNCAVGQFLVPPAWLGSKALPRGWQLNQCVAIQPLYDKKQSNIVAGGKTRVNTAKSRQQVTRRKAVSS